MRSVAKIKREKAVTRLDAAYNKDVPVFEPGTKWIGDDFNGALHVSAHVRQFDQISIDQGLHVLDLFSGITCGGLRIVLEIGNKVACYTGIEIDDTSYARARCVLSKLQ